MKPNTRIFKMTNNGIYINNDELIPYSNTNLPKKNFTLSDTKPIFWLVEVRLEKKGIGNIIVAKVIDYQYDSNTSFQKQSIKSDIPFIEFEKLDYNQVVYNLASYQPNKIKDMFHNYPNIPETKVKEYNNIQATEKKMEKNYSLKEKVNFSDAIILDGGVQCNIHNPHQAKKVSVVIENKNLKKEYNTIKEYFSKKLGRRTFVVTVEIKEVEFKIVEIRAHSDTIDMITENFISTIRYKQIKSLTNIHKNENSKNIHTIDTLLLESGEIKENVFQIDINDIIKILTDNIDHRNSRQLKSLSKKHNTEEIIYLTLNPWFGFVFYVKGKGQYHYIWELLDSHATYIWSYAVNEFLSSEIYSLLELEINSIYNIGRNEYKNKIKGQHNYSFTSIEHLSDSEKNMAFEKWLIEVESIITN